MLVTLWLRLLGPRILHPRRRKVVAHHARNGVLGAENPLKAGEGGFKQRNGFGDPLRGLVGDGEVVAGDQGVWVVAAQDPLVVGD